MIDRAISLAFDVYARRRRRAWEHIATRAMEIQERTLLRLVAMAKRTEFGRSHGFAEIRSVSGYQTRVPVGDYLTFHERWKRVAGGAEDVTWPGRPRFWVKTSGTTAGDKHIPVTPEAFASHRRGGWDSFAVAAEKAGSASLLGGPMLFLGGSNATVPYGNGCQLADLSGLAVRRLPPVIRRRYSPGPSVASISDWERRLNATAALAAWQDIRLLAGMPSWTAILLERIAAVRQQAGQPIRTLADCWRHLQVFIHGGVAFPPYMRCIEERLGQPVHRVEVYPASEGFIALQTEATGGLTLMLDYGIFYEFIPVEDLGNESPRRHTVAEVKLGRPYAIALSTPSGLWSYLLGDTIRFTARDPLRLVIIGRTRHFVNAFGENVIVEEVEQACFEACQRADAEVVEFTVAPRYPTSTESRGSHDWLVEFRHAPAHLATFSRILDETLMRLNTDYRTKRTGDVGMLAPRVIPLPPGTFYRWMAACGKLGDQHKVPRATNDRVVAEGLLTVPHHLADEHTSRGDACPESPWLASFAARPSQGQRP
jgi:hypothetical protein